MTYRPVLAILAFKKSTLGGDISALVSPHIDPMAGADVYASAYQALGDHSPKRELILGTGHQLTDGLFCLTEKDFVTPLGTAKNEIAVTRQLREAAGEVHTIDDFAHRSKHSNVRERFCDISFITKLPRNRPSALRQ